MPRTCSIILAIAVLFASGCSSDRPVNDSKSATSAPAASGPPSAWEGKLVKAGDNDPKIYLIEKGKKRWVTSPDALQKHGFQWDDVKRVSAADLTAVPEGAPIQ